MDAVELGELDRVVLLLSSKTGKALLLFSEVGDANHTAALLLKTMKSPPELNPNHFGVLLSLLKDL